MAQTYLNIDEESGKFARMSQQQTMLLKRRIEEMKRNNTAVYIGQPTATQTDDECFAEITEACNMFLKTMSEEDEKKLAQVLEKHNLQLYNYPPDVQDFTKTQSFVARAAFNGTLPPMASLRPNNFIFRTDNGYKDKIKPEDYDFSGTKWEVFRQIPEFAEFEDKLRQGLAKRGISQAMLPKLREHDICYLLEEPVTPPKRLEDSVRFMNESHKARNTKRFIAEYENEFRAGLMAMPNVRKDYVETLIRAMKAGSTDLTNYEGGKFWKKEWADQPVVTAHHIRNVKDSDSMEWNGKKWYNVNDYENMCFIVHYPQHKAMHLLENIKFNERKTMTFEERRKDDEQAKQLGRYRIQPPPGVRCMLGFHNMIYDRRYVEAQEIEKNAIKERNDNDPNRISGNKGRNNQQRSSKNNYLKDRQNWSRTKNEYLKRR